MSEFVSNQPVADVRARSVRTRPEEDVASDRECARAERAAQSVGMRIRVQADIPQVVAEMWLQSRAELCVERVPAPASPLDFRLDLR
jgi:hypothetical protein